MDNAMLVMLSGCLVVCGTGAVLWRGNFRKMAVMMTIFIFLEILYLSVLQQEWRELGWNVYVASGGN